MLRIYPVALDVLRSLRTIIAQLERHDTDLAKQLRRASASVVLNLAEGMYSRGKNRSARYHSALGSMRETMACVEVGLALGYLTAVDEKLMHTMDVIVGTLVKLVR